MVKKQGGVVAGSAGSVGRLLDFNASRAQGLGFETSRHPFFSFSLTFCLSFFLFTSVNSNGQKKQHATTTGISLVPPAPLLEIIWFHQTLTFRAKGRVAPDYTGSLLNEGMNMQNDVIIMDHIF